MPSYIPEDVNQRLGLKRDPLGSHLVDLPGLRASQMRLQLRSNDHKSTESSLAKDEFLNAIQWRKFEE